ncbi:HAD-IIB family hydrolase [Streptomyces coacervatus]|nr:HAD-IIB family hydrolase [Streptomyces coacervatus]MDF2272048.1 HAD-IIB family hydrolase [Streptomyces coacervatus]
MPDTVHTVVFSDFDETYLAHASTPDQVSSRAALEDWLEHASRRHGLLFGWVTGSSLDSVLRKSDTHALRVLPHFMACSLGTELYAVDETGPRLAAEWQHSLPDAAYIRGHATRAVQELGALGVPLRPQLNRGPESRVISHYYRTRGPEQDAQNLALIRRTARRFSLGVYLSRCNPLTGDPDDCYDVDFLPGNCGKSQVVDYICRRYGVDPAKSFAFGDSGNDLDMLTAVGHGVLVGNCTEEARSLHPRVSTKSYADAILFELQEVLQ